MSLILKNTLPDNRSRNQQNQNSVRIIRTCAEPCTWNVENVPTHQLEIQETNSQRNQTPCCHPKHDHPRTHARKPNMSLLPTITHNGYKCFQLTFTHHMRHVQMLQASLARIQSHAHAKQKETHPRPQQTTKTRTSWSARTTVTTHKS